MFNSPTNLRINPGCLHFAIELLHHIINETLPVEPPFVQKSGNMHVLLWFQIAERQIFQLPLDMTNAQTMRQRGIDIEHLAGNAVTLVIRRILDGTNSAGALRQLDQCYAHIINHGH